MQDPSGLKPHQAFSDDTIIIREVPPLQGSTTSTASNFSQFNEKAEAQVTHPEQELIRMQKDKEELHNEILKLQVNHTRRTPPKSITEQSDDGGGRADLETQSNQDSGACRTSTVGAG